MVVGNTAIWAASSGQTVMFHHGSMAMEATNNEAETEPSNESPKENFTTSRSRTRQNSSPE
jgi:stringent starvation protein B